MGRAKKKPEYDQNRIMEQFQNCIVEAYTSGIADGTGISLRQVSEEFGITLMKTRKILITAGIGCGITSASGSKRFPTIHKVFLSSTELSEEQQRYVSGLLRLYRDEITISKKQLNAFMNHSGLDLKFKSNIERALTTPETFYNIPINMIQPPVPNEKYAQELSLLLQYSSMPCNDKITKDETDLAPCIISPGK